MLRLITSASDLGRRIRRIERAKIVPRLSPRADYDVGQTASCPSDGAPDQLRPERGVSRDWYNEVARRLPSSVRPARELLAVCTRMRRSESQALKDSPASAFDYCVTETFSVRHRGTAGAFCECRRSVDPCSRPETSDVGCTGEATVRAPCPGGCCPLPLKGDHRCHLRPSAVEDFGDPRAVHRRSWRSRQQPRRSTQSEARQRAGPVEGSWTVPIMDTFRV